MWIDAASVAAFDNRVDHCAALSRIGVSEKQPVLRADGRGSDSIFNSVVVDFDTTISDMLGEKLPVREGVVDCFPECAQWEMPLGGLHFFQRSLEAVQYHRALTASHNRS